MRELYLRSEEGATADTLQRLSNNSPHGILCPRLEQLRWNTCETDSALLFVRLFLSPRLKKVALYSYPMSTHSGLPTAVTQVISLLPTSLEDVSIECSHEGDEALADAISSFVCRCRPSLRSFGAWLPLSEVATQHVVQLPNLCSWTVAHGPPRTVPAPILLSLEQVHFKKLGALPWLPLLASHQKGTIRNSFASATSHTGTREGLKSITCPTNTIVDPTFLSSIVAFRNLATLRVQTHCSWSGGCTFHLTDDDMENLATVLPRLEILDLGAPCRYDSCNNTVASLLSTSVHCLDLRVLQTHFNTTTIVSDMQRLLDRGTESDTPKCKLSKLTVGSLLLKVHGEDIETVAMGFKVIFPYLKDVGYIGDWHKLSYKFHDE